MSAIYENNVVSQPINVLVVEDENKIANFIANGLKEVGFVPELSLDWNLIVERVKSHQVDVIVLDLMLPEFDGMDLLKTIRIYDATIPVLVLSAKADIEVRVQALDLGSNDYLTKPFDFAELSARLRSLVRMRKHHQITLTCEDLILDTRSHDVIRAGQSIELSNKEYSLLEFLVKNNGIVMTRKQILQHVWKLDYDPATNVVDVYINYIRKKVDEGFDLKLIHTIRGKGYCIGDIEPTNRG